MLKDPRLLAEKYWSKDLVTFSKNGAILKCFRTKRHPKEQYTFDKDPRGQLKTVLKQQFPIV